MRNPQHDTTREIKGTIHNNTLLYIISTLSRVQDIQYRVKKMSFPIPCYIASDLCVTFLSIQLQAIA